MATQKQRRAARRNIKKAARAARRKQTLKKLPKKTRIALGKQAAKVAKRRRRYSILYLNLSRANYTEPIGNVQGDSELQLRPAGL
ncbi:MAG: hypothetical protein E6J89_12495 [Deltaproteobacteria bacterium]|nr:MAG: hypothetical protein E6J89_12495 [Deltaproteobacteria bacterium]